jgi:hypothetical protein
MTTVASGFILTFCALPATLARTFPPFARNARKAATFTEAKHDKRHCREKEEYYGDDKHRTEGPLERQALTKSITWPTQ